MLDVEKIAPCMPGAQVLEQTGEDAYKVAVKVKLGPMTMNYKGDIEIVDADASTHAATMRAKAKEARGQGTASADIQMPLREAGSGTTASIRTAMKMSGKAAAMGQGVIKDVAASLTATFAENPATLIDRGPETATAAPAPAEPAPASGPKAEAGPTPTSGSKPGARPAREVRSPPYAAPDAPAQEASLPVGEIAVAIVSGRLQDPATVGVLGLLLFVAGVLVGRRRG